MKAWIPSVFIIVTGLVLTGQAETLYLQDGSVLTGTVLNERTKDLVISNDNYGELVILKANIIYRDALKGGVQTESFDVTADSAAVVARLQRAVPRPLPSDGSINQLIPGDVQSIMTLKGRDVAFDKYLIADNSLISIATGNLPSDAEWIILTSLQSNDITDLNPNQKRFRLRYQLNEKTHLKIVVKLPASVTVQSVTPKPQLQSNGLIIWNRTLERQQIFQPEIVFSP